MRSFKKIIAVFASIAILSCMMAAPVSAADVVYKDESSYWAWLASQNPGFFAHIIAFASGDVCTAAEDGRHAAASYDYDASILGYVCVCDLCGSTFTGYESEMPAGYEAYVSDIESEYSAVTFGSDGAVYYVATHNGFYGYDVNTRFHGCEHDPSYAGKNDAGNIYAYCCESGNYSIEYVQDSSKQYFLYCRYLFTCPVGGSYKVIVDFHRRVTSGDYVYDDSNYREVFDYGLKTASAKLDYLQQLYYGYDYDSCAPTSVIISFDNILVECVPNSGGYDLYNGELLNSNSRPTSITGNYGIVGDDGSVTNIGTQTIVNEGSSTYYNPVTNTSYDLSGWTYDYSTRTYDLSTTEGDTITVEYGDETVNITEGDTVYNIYYLVEEDTSSGDDEDSSGSTGDEDCDHSYTSETTKASTCLLSGKETFTCSECGDTYTETIPATGHDWSVLQTVNSQYDDTGALVTEGYTIYQCGTCGEQYKSTDGAAPPGGSSSSGGTIWEKIGTLFGTIADGVIGMIETAVSTLLDGLISLATVISEKGQQVIELILGFFKKIPELFGAFPDFLGAVFPFIPDEILLIIEFGLAAVVFAAIIKFFKKG